MKLWIDDVRPAPEGYMLCTSVNNAKCMIEIVERDILFANLNSEIELIDIDHDAGEYAYDGGDFIKLLDWLEETSRNYPSHIHSQNVVGRMNMEAICRRNNWTIVP
jgi:hypothetical protein